MSVAVNVEVIIAAILGGTGTPVGAAIGGVVLVLIREQLSGVAYTLPGTQTPVSDVDFLVFAVITLVLLYALPGGIIRWAVSIGNVATDGGKPPTRQVYESYTEQLRELFGGGER